MADWACAVCGGANPDGMRFCGHCGSARLPADDSTPGAPPTPIPASPRTPASPAAALGSAVRGYVSEEAASRFAATQQAFSEDHRLITALFADISGFTALAQRVDTEELLEIIDPLVARLGAIVARYEGTVEKYAGDAILAVFGAPTAHDDDASRALLVALEMHRELARALPELGPGAAGLTLHVGVNSGHAIARVMGSEARLDYGVLGDSVIVAQRLESQAPGGETYVGASTVALVGDRFTLVPIGGLAMKGKAEPVPAWRLIGEARAPARSGRTAAPSGADGAFVGRAAETARLTERLDAVGRGEGALLTITGEPGVGKSRLVGRAEALASERGVAWSSTRCASFGRSVTYGPYALLVREWAGIEVDDPPDRALESLARATDGAGLGAARPLFGRLLGIEEPGRDDGTLGPEAFRRALHAAFLTWLAAPDASPRVLLIEDVHWIDQASLALTEELAAAASSAALLLVLTARPEAESIGALAAQPGVRAASIILRPLDADDTAMLVADQLAGPPSTALVAFVHDRTAGNPFFVRETLRALQHEGVLAPGPGGVGLTRGWDAAAVPPTIEGVLAARIDRLPARERDVLQVASVLGRQVRGPLLEAVVDDAAGLTSLVGALVETGLLDELDADAELLVAFHHALVQDVAYGRLLRRRRRELHGRAADAIERLYGSGDDIIDVLARHLYLARAGDRAVAALLRAAVRAASFFSNEEAILALERAAEILAAADATDQGRLHEVRLQAAELYERTGRYPEAMAGYLAVREAADAPRAWLGMARTHRSLGEYEDALRTVEEAIAGLGAEVDRRPFLLEHARSLAHAGRPDEAVAVAREGIAIASDGEAAVTGHLLLQLARARTIAGAADEAIGHAEEAIAILDRQRDIPGLASGYRTLGYAYARAGRQEEAETALLQALATAERTGSSDEIGGTLVNLGVLAMDRDRADDAVGWYGRAIAEFERIGHGSGRVTGYANLADALVHRGDLDDAQATAERALELARSLGHALAGADALDTMAAIAQRRGQVATAAGLERDAAVAYRSAGATSRAREAYEQAADWWHAAGDEASASAATADARLLPS